MEETDLKQEFRELLKLSNWSQAEAARQLAMTPGALSQIVRENSPVRPSRGTLRLLRLLVEQGKASEERALALSESWEVDLIVSLRKLSPGVRAPLLKAFGTLIEANLTRIESHRSQ